MNTEPAATPRGLIARCIEFCSLHPWTTLLSGVALTVAGALSLRTAPLDALPDLSDVQVIVFTEWEGQSPDLVESQVTYPLSSTLLSTPRIQNVRGLSMFGMSFVYAIFEDGTDIYWARARITEQLTTLRNRLPDNANPVLGPDASAVGWVYQYVLTDPSGRTDLGELRQLHDSFVRYALTSVPGVAEVATVGGYEPEYQITADPQLMRAYGVTADDLFRAVRSASQDSGAGVLEIAGHEHAVRLRAYARTITELEQTPLRAMDQGTMEPTAPRLKQVAHISRGPADRRGFVDWNGRGEAIAGTVVMRHGENALQVIDAVKVRLDELRTSLPDGVEIHTAYDRSELIRASNATLTETLLEEMLVVALIIFVFLRHARSAWVALITLPMAVLMAFIPMYLQGITANIMSLGGIAVAIGEMVDAAIVLVENIHKKLEGRSGIQGRERRRLIIEAMVEVGPSLFFSLLIITVSFLPVLTLQGAEGRLFKPLAYTKTWSMAWGALLAITVVPALAVLLIRGRISPEEAHPINRWLIRSYSPIVRGVVRHRKAVVLGALGLLLSTVPVWLALGREFMPPLQEGVILYMPTSPPGMGATDASRVLQAMDADLREIPEVESVMGKMGRTDSPTDSAPIGMAEITIVLKPREQWRPGLTYEALIADMDARMQYPGMPNLWWMPVQTRTEMLATGVRSPLGIQILGADLGTLETVAEQIQAVVARVPGVRSAFADRASGGYFLDVDIRRADAARYGLTVEDIQMTVQIAVGGMVAATTLNDRYRIPIRVRYAPDFRQTPEALGRVLLRTSTGEQVPLASVADIHTSLGPPMIRSEAGQLTAYVFADSTRPIGDFVDDARAAVSREIQLPPGIRLQWQGQFRYLERAMQRLLWVIPLTLLLIVLLLYLNTRSWVETGMVLLAVPFSLIGAIWLLWALDYNVSIGTWVGLIALAGLDAETGVVMLLYLTMAWRDKRRTTPSPTTDDLEAAIVQGAAQRIRPKLMTMLTTMIGLIPILWSTGSGADVMKRIAAPMVGGIASSFLLELLVYPAVFALWQQRTLSTPSQES